MAVLKKKEYSLLYSLPHCQSTDEIKEGCLVLEGGAFRGVYTSGVLDALMLYNYNFQTTIGCSAGCLTGVCYVSGDIGRSGFLNLKFRHDSNYVGTKSLAKERNVIGFEYMFFGEPDKEYPLNRKRLETTKREMYAVVTNVENGNTEYMEMHSFQLDDFFKVCQASSSMPFLSPMVKIQNSYYLDGGCSCKIPYRFALDKGYSKVIVVRTRDSSFRKEKMPIQEKELIKVRYSKYKEFSRKLVDSNEEYNRECDEIEELKKQGKIFIIEPSLPIDIERLEGNMEKLGEVYWRGYHDAIRLLPSLREFLEK